MTTTALKNLKRGSLAAISKTLGVHVASVMRWADGRVPAERVLDVERATGISRHDLRPDIYPLARPARVREGA